MFLLGESGLLERLALTKKKEVMIERVNSLKEENLKLEAEAASNTGASPSDFLKAGFIPEGKRLLVLNGIKEDETAPPVKTDEYSGFRMSYLRGIYCVLSLLILLFYFSYFGRSERRDA